MGNSISSPEDSTLESYLGLNIHFFALARCIGLLVPKVNLGSSESSPGEGKYSMVKANERITFRGWIVPVALKEWVCLS